MDQEIATSVGSNRDQPKESYKHSANEDIIDDIRSLEVKNVEEDEASSSCVMDVNDENLDDILSQRLCRICHLCSLETGKSLLDLIELGCGCKGELGFAHSQCGEAWFKIKGNRICEICGKIAKNINGSVENRFMEEWNEDRAEGNFDFDSYENNRGCWQGFPLRNFLMACLVIAFVLPWFFRVNMF